LSLDQLAGPSPDLSVCRDAPGEIDAWLVVVGVEALDDEVRQQRLIVKRRGHTWQSSSREALKDVALELYDVTVSITAFEPNRHIEWTIFTWFLAPGVPRPIPTS
jgi:hypothetical protein